MPNNTQPDVTQQSPQLGRLQRGPTAKGYRVASFTDILKRHGTTMGCLAVICLIAPGSLSTIAATSTKFILQPLPYFFALLSLLVFFSVWTARRPGSIKRKTQWIFYLLYISIVEELTFRVIFPSLLTPHFSWLTANIVSNVLFAGIHYITLRWKLRNCIVTFVGGMGLSQLMTHGDLTLVVLIHWLGTFINTPFPPTGKNNRSHS